MATLAALPAYGQTSAESVKAAYLPKFVRYVEFPGAATPRPGSPFYLCIIGRDPFGALIDRAAAGERVDDRPVAVRRFSSAASPEVAGCHIAFVAGGNSQATARALKALRRQATLTVTDARLDRTRGMIHFQVSDGRVRFQIDKAAAAACGIVISSRLLALAVDVSQRTP